MVYFAVEDPDATIEQVKQLGGSAIAGPYEMAMGKLAVVQDPQGAVFALYSGQLEP